MVKSKMLPCSIQLLLKIIFLLYALAILFTAIKMSSIPLENYLINQKKLVRKDWNDYAAMYIDDLRTGPGEHGKEATLSADMDLVQENITYNKYGFNGLVSDMISVNRSLSDQRPKGCRHIKYLSELPAISVVIPFYNEYLSVLLRSLHSIINRTPPELLKEIIIVDDFSQFENLGKQLDQYVANHFNKVQIVRLPARMGLIRARMAGIRKATAEVLVIFDSHIEVNYNWLPPLLEPIALNKRTVVSPYIDTIAFKNFKYVSKTAKRGGFAWDLTYRSIRLSPEDLKDETKPFMNPVMLGGLFAMSAEFFFELGGYDEGLDIWGGEQYELSFKIWMCGGQLMDVPCSRVGHLYRDGNFRSAKARRHDYMARNTKRVAEVWMDEYKNYISKFIGIYYDAIDAGDLTERKAIREKLKCKSFKWYLETAAKDVIKFYPPVDPPAYAYGAIQSVASPKLCLDTNVNWLEIGLYPCARNLTHPHTNQNFALSFLREIKRIGSYICFDSWLDQKNSPIAHNMCHVSGGNQFWYYDRQNKWIVHKLNGTRCIEASPSNMKVYTNICDKNNLNMKWNFGVVNDTALDKFFENL